MKDDPQALFHIQTPGIEQTQRPKTSWASHRTAKENVSILLGEKAWMKPFQTSNPGIFLKRTSQFETISEQLSNSQSSVVSYTILLANAKWLHEEKNIPSFVPEPWHFFFHQSSLPKPEGLNFNHEQLCPLELPQFLTDAGMSLHCIVGIKAACE